MPRPKATVFALSTVFSVWMLSSMWRVGKRRVGGVHMIRNETGKAQVALQ